MNKYLKSSPIGAKNWYRFNKEKLDQNELSEIFFPRFIYGDYLKYRMIKAMNKAKKNVTIDYYHSKVIDLKKNKNFQVNCADNSRFYSKKIVLSIGSPNYNSLDKYTKSTFCKKILIDDIYSPSLKSNINLTISKDNLINLMIIGSNATTLEVLYNLYINDTSFKKINRVFIVSKSAELPAFMKNFDSNHSKDFKHFKLLKENKCISSFKIIKCLKNELKEIPQDQRSDYYNSISEEVIELFKKLDTSEQKKFVYKYGFDFITLTRRCGIEHYSAIKTLINSNKLRMIKGKILGFEGDDSNSFTF